MKIKKLGIRAASGLWNPRSLNPILWFDAQDITTITKTGANLVTNWRNKGSAGNATPPGGTDSYKPLWVSSGAISGYPALRFDGDVNALSGSLSFTGNTGSFFFFGCQNTQLDTTTGGILEMANTLQSAVSYGHDNNIVWLRRATTLWRTMYNNTMYLPMTASFNTVFMWTTIRSSVDQMMYAYYNDADTAFNSIAVLNTRLFNSNIYTIGVNLGANGVPNTLNNAMDIFEILLFTTALSTSEKNKVAGYVAHKWGRADLLPANHPYKSAPP